jgi:hypothetical protein
MSEPRSPDTRQTDPKEHAAQLLDQADRLVQLARELRREARRLNGSLGLPEHRPLESSGPADEADRPPQRRFVPAAEQEETAGSETDGGEPEISDGARLLITGMAAAGSSREEILEVIHEELGLENGAAILERLSL